MRTGRPILFSVILALSAAGAILTGPAIASAAATHAPAVHAHAHYRRWARTFTITRKIKTPPLTIAQIRPSAPHSIAPRQLGNSLVGRCGQFTRPGGWPPGPGICPDTDLFQRLANHPSHKSAPASPASLRRVSRPACHIRPVRGVRVVTSGDEGTEICPTVTGWPLPSKSTASICERWPTGCSARRVTLRTPSRTPGCG